MSFTTISLCAGDEAFAQRARAGYASEGTQQPDGAWNANRWLIAADPSISQAYGYAVETGNPNPGGDETVITGHHAARRRQDAGAEAAEHGRHPARPRLDVQRSGSGFGVFLR